MKDKQENKLWPCKLQLGESWACACLGGRDGFYGLIKVDRCINMVHSQVALCRLLN